LYGQDRKISYFGVRLGDNSTETPEGFLVFHDAVIGRTGMQEYRMSELPQDEAADCGLDAAPQDLIQLYRDPEEVFSRVTMDSFEGKSLTDGHPAKLLTIETALEHHEGHIQNIRKAGFLLESGDEAMIADVVVMSPSLKSKIRAGLRELSCGYTYHIVRSGDRILQVDIKGNHVAVVPSGRAGSEAALNDSAIAKEPTVAKKPEGMTWTRFLSSVGLAGYAKDATTQEVAEAMHGIATEAPAAVATPAAIPAAVVPAAVGMDAGTKEANDARMAADRKAMDRKKYHDALDKEMDRKEAEAMAGEDEHEELRKGLASMFGADAMAGDEEDDEEDQESAGDAHPEEEDDEEGEAGDESEHGPEDPEIMPVEDRPKNPSPGTGMDGRRKGGKGKGATGTDGAIELLKLFRPVVAASKDKKVRAAFDHAVRAVQKGRGTVRSGASYGRFAGAAATGHDAAPSVDQQSTDLNALYAGMRGKAVVKS
jgi:hypothetical protein